MQYASAFLFIYNDFALYLYKFLLILRRENVDINQIYLLYLKWNPPIAFLLFNYLCYHGYYVSVRFGN